MTRAARWWAVAVIVVVAATAAVVAVTRPDPSPWPLGTMLGERSASILSSDDVRLAADVYTPRTTPSQLPLVVMPVPFGARGTAYHSVARSLSDRGYVVITYLQRGFHESQGDVDFAGPTTQADVSTVITWALAHTPADPDHVGLMGMSYGAGVSLLAAARDPRIRAVAALSTWTDFDRSFDDNHTPSTIAMSSLVGEAARRLSPSVEPMATSVRTPTAFDAELARIAPTRSPQTYVDQLNHNDPAIMIANAYEDSFFAPAQLVTFFDALTTPKRLQLAIGDHGGPEYSALHGEQNSTVTDAFAWLDHYLRGQRNDIASQSPIQLEDARTKVVHTYATWPATGPAVALGTPNVANDVGTPTAWSAPRTSGTDSGATSGPFQVGSSADYHPPLIRLNAVNTSAGLVWSGSPLATAKLVSGTPRLHVRLASSTTTATVFAYLYEVDSGGLGALMNVQPYTATQLTPGLARSVTFDMEPISWTTRAGDHLVLVVDTADPRFGSVTPTGSTVTVSSTVTDPATLSVPLGPA